ncbi:MAG: hypothetical protein HOP08_00860 [Cyclobacteriaceae bacterium]|nr:hypothetical protein [Cyclobacteriaceae bacterium]
MEKSSFAQEISKIRMAVIIENIQTIRNQRALDLLDDASLMSFLEEHFNTIAISAIKREFLKRDLTLLQNSSLDLEHYSSLITQMKDANIEIPDVNHPLFLHELNSLVKKYGFHSA